MIRAFIKNAALTLPAILLLVACGPARALDQVNKDTPVSDRTQEQTNHTNGIGHKSGYYIP